MTVSRKGRIQVVGKWPSRENELAAAELRELAAMLRREWRERDRDVIPWVELSDDPVNA
jgi:hypothetical protein